MAAWVTSCSRVFTPLGQTTEPCYDRKQSSTSSNKSSPIRSSLGQSSPTNIPCPEFQREQWTTSSDTRDMATENQNKPSDNQHTRDKRYECVLRTVDDLVDNHISRLQRWLTTWGKVDHSHIRSMAESTHGGCGTILTSIPVLDAMQTQAELQVSTVIERVEHLVTLCNNKTT